MRVGDGFELGSPVFGFLEWDEHELGEVPFDVGLELVLERVERARDQLVGVRVGIA